MSRVRLLAGIASVLALAVLLGGCGRGYSKRDFVARADAICDGAVRDARSIAPPTPSGSPRQRLTALAGYFAQVLPVVQSEATEILALRRPGGDAHDRGVLARYLTALAQTAHDYRNLVAAARRGDAQGVATAEAALRTSQAAPLATRYGLRSCGSPGATAA